MVERADAKTPPIFGSGINRERDNRERDQRKSLCQRSNRRRIQVSDARIISNGIYLLGCKALSSPGAVEFEPTTV